ncbi:hypothetical protein ABBQ32_004816 [Trebouxia sp. C0010 RCD-2024]
MHLVRHCRMHAVGNRQHIADRLRHACYTLSGTFMMLVCLANLFDDRHDALQPHMQTSYYLKCTHVCMLTCSLLWHWLATSCRHKESLLLLEQG